MGFTTGLLSGTTLTLSTLYLTLLLHRRNRYAQSHDLASSTATLTAIYDPPPIVPPPTQRIENAGLLQMAKDRWNAMLIEDVRRINETDWRRKREEVEGVMAGVWRGLRRSLEGGEKLQEAVREEVKGELKGETKKR